MDNLQYSRPIDVHRISEYPEVQNVISYLLSLLKEEGLIKNSPVKGILKHLKVVVLDLYVAYMRDPLVYVAYPRGSDAYGPGTRLRKLHLGLDSMKKVVDGLSSLGYLDDHGGFHDRTTGVGYLSRMRATSSLISLIQDYDIVTSMVSTGYADVIVLREVDIGDDGKDKKELPFEDTGSAGDGTYGVHWEEDGDNGKYAFENELMTGISEGGSIGEPLSAVTVGALEDAGYEVDYDAADPWTGTNTGSGPAGGMAIGSVESVKGAIQGLANYRAQIGAQLSYTNKVNSALAIEKENMMQASSRIKDTDIASESTQYAKNKILVQSATAMTAQANLLPQMVLQLIG